MTKLGINKKKIKPQCGSSHENETLQFLECFNVKIF
jgi:hypothetical protein